MQFVHAVKLIVGLQARIDDLTDRNAPDESICIEHNCYLFDIRSVAVLDTLSWDGFLGLWYFGWLFLFGACGVDEGGRRAGGVRGDGRGVVLNRAVPRHQLIITLVTQWQRREVRWVHQVLILLHLF